jgi:hypothetical protein
MQRWMALVYALLLVGAVALMITRGGGKGRGVAGPADAGADAAAGSEDGGPEDAGAGGGPGQAGSAEGSGRNDAGGTLLSGEAPPPLAAEAPKRVKFGVILIQYKGAQGAPPSTRPRDAALALANELAAEAKVDFKAAVAKGDKGSTEDLGYMPRGILEPAPEYELFSLPKGGVGGPVDTPRGFWIVRRIE